MKVLTVSLHVCTCPYGCHTHIIKSHSKWFSEVNSPNLNLIRPIHKKKKRKEERKDGWGGPYTARWEVVMIKWGWFKVFHPVTEEVRVHSALTFQELQSNINNSHWKLDGLEGEQRRLSILRIDKLNRVTHTAASKYKYSYITYQGNSHKSWLVIMSSWSHLTKLKL